jgi:hypothetical protein
VKFNGNVIRWLLHVPFKKMPLLLTDPFHVARSAR